MSNVRRVYVEKKPAFAVQAKELKHEISSYLGIKSVTSVRVLIRYDVENISDEVFEKACRTVFAEPPVDDLYKESFESGKDAKIFSVNIFRDSLTRERIPQYSVCSFLMRMHSRSFVPLQPM